MLTSLDNLQNAADALFYYIKYFLLYAVPNQYQSLQAFMNKIFEILDWLFDKALVIATSELEIVAIDVDGQEEQVACAQDIYEEFQKIVEQLGFCYIQIIEKYKQDQNVAVFKQVTDRAIQFMQRDLSQSINQFVYAQGSDIYAKFAVELPKQMVEQMFEPVLPLMFEVCQKFQKEKILQASVYYCFLEYLQKTRDSRVSGLLAIAKQTLEHAQEEEQEEVFNNVCSFMVLCGQALELDSDFWEAMLDFVARMEEDDYEQMRVIRVLLEQFPAMSQPVQVKTVQVVCGLYFGTFHQQFLEEPEYQKQQVKTFQFLKQQGINQIAKEFVQTDEILLKNATADEL